MSEIDEDAAHVLVANERAKLMATYVNGVAVGLSVLGSVGPIFSFLFAQPSLRPAIGVLIAAMAICRAMSVCLHLFARRTLGGLRP
jgi:hypothetical protein